MGGRGPSKDSKEPGKCWRDFHSCYNETKGGINEEPLNQSKKSDADNSIVIKKSIVNRDILQSDNLSHVGANC